MIDEIMKGRPAEVRHAKLIGVRQDRIVDERYGVQREGEWVVSLELEEVPTGRRFDVIFANDPQMEIRVEHKDGMAIRIVGEAQTHREGDFTVVDELEPNRVEQRL